ncbi:MAG: hypothetical protein H0W15_00820 [Gemmatimonadales bacterium]|nr:hypothetical protein [Gemmatimonadales bacterium]
MLILLAAAVMATLPPALTETTTTTAPYSFSVAPDSTAVLFARARESARDGRSAEAIRYYLAGARAAGQPAEWDLYRRDLSWVATTAEMKAFGSLGDAARIDWIRDFWASRDARDGLAAGGRFAEHVRRIDIAVAEYAIDPKRGKVPVARGANSSGSAFDLTVGAGSPLRDFVPRQGQVDDRGTILIRHGEPDARATAGSGIESWVYDREEGDNLVVHFSQNVFDGSSGNTTLIAAPPVPALEALCGLDSASCSVAQRVGGAAPERRERLRQRALAAIRELTTTESAAPRAE